MAKQIEEKKSNKEVGESVITPKQRYFLPIEGITVEADDVDEATTKAKQQKDAEVGDDDI